MSGRAFCSVVSDVSPKTTRKCEVATSKYNGRVPCQTDGTTPEINSMAVIIDWLTKEGNYNRWRGGDKQNARRKWALPMNSVNSSKIRASLWRGQEGTSMSGSIVLSNISRLQQTG